ncbi:uncharacterized protein LOC117320860 [Pecten maximus]|uniref:uncharacterized protein LOC117320860 n=1 Tax=Pecten maximus TaxID=6579 RepID=UPI0014591A15|nr:uncharacterized protein LOC117320860 [Pecten maximus]
MKGRKVMKVRKGVIEREVMKGRKGVIEREVMKGRKGVIEREVMKGRKGVTCGSMTPRSHSYRLVERGINKGRHSKEGAHRPDQEEKARQKDRFPMPEARFQRKVLTLLAEIRDMHSHRVLEDDGKISRLQQMDSLEKLEGFEKEIDEPTKKKAVKDYISRIRGVDANSHVKQELSLKGCDGKNESLREEEQACLWKNNSMPNNHWYV